MFLCKTCAPSFSSFKSYGRCEICGALGACWDVSGPVGKDNYECEHGVARKDWCGTNPKDAIGSRKAGISTIPGQVMAELGLSMLEGACKYGRHNYRVSRVRSSVYYDAAFRHLAAWWEGEDIDPDSGLSHLVKAMACLAVLRDAQIQGMLNDDRPPASKPGWVAEMNNKAAEILDRYPEPKVPFTAKDGGK